MTDPEFPGGGNANPPSGGGWRKHMILPKFPKKLHKIERIWTRGAGPKFHHDSPLVGVPLSRVGVLPTPPPVWDDPGSVLKVIRSF